MRGAVAFALCAAVVAAQDDASSRLRDGDPAVRAAAAEEIGKRGPAAALAVPQLIELVYDDFDAPSKAAMVALGRIGPAASEARPYLVDRTLGRGDFEPIVTQALARIGPPDADAPLVAWLRAKGAVPAGPCTLEDLANRNLKAQLLEALGNEHALVVAQAARLLGPAARTNEEVVAALVPLLDHPSACVRLNAGVAVSYSPLAEATFAKMLEDKDPKRRRVAARFLRGPGAVPLLRRALRDPDAAVRCWAVGGFSTQDVRGNPGLVAELATLLDRDPLLCSLFSTLLGTLGAEAAPAVPAFARCLASADPDLRWSACYVLGRIGEHAGPAAVPLAFAAFDEREQVAIAAVQALTAIGAAARDAAPYLAELAEADLSLGPHARRTLAVIGAGVPLPPLPDPAELPALKAELAGDDGKSAGRAAFAIGRLAANDPETLEALGAALSHPSPYARKHAALALQRIGPSSLPLIARAGAGPDPGRRLAAGTLIHFAGVAPDNLVPVAVGLLASDDAFVKREAIRSLGVAGTRGRDAVPTLVACLRDENAEIVQVSIWALGRMRADATGAVPFLIEILDTSGHRDHALMAVQALGEIGQTAAPAIPSIVAAARRPKIGAQLFNPSVDALASMGPAGQAAVVQLIREEKGHEREYAITVLVQRSLSPPGLKEALEEVLKNCDAQTREVALTAIRQLGPESKPSLESLLAALKSGPLDTRARAQIVWGIAEAAPVADLLKMARDKDAKLRQVGFEALSMKPQTAFTDADRLQVLPLILDALEHGDAALQASAAATLPNAPPKSFDERLLRLVGNRGPAQSHLSRAIVAMGPEVVPKLTMALSGDSRDLRNGAAIALAQFGPAARMAIPALVEAVLDDPAASTEFVRAIIATKDLERFAALFADPRMPNRERFGDALVAAGVDALPHFDTLRRHPDVATRREAVALLGRLGDAAAPALLEAAEDKEPSVASAALRSFGRSVPPGMAIPVLVRAVGDDALRDAAIEGLSAHRLAAKEALKTLAADPRPKVRAAVLPILALPGQPALELLDKSLTDPDPTVRAAGAHALGRLGADAAPALPGLRTLLDDTEPPVRRAAASTLGRMGAGAEAAVPDLIQMMRRGDAQDRVAAARALASIGAAGAPALAGLLSNPEEALRRAVQQALVEMGEPAVPAVAALLGKDEKTRREAAETLARIGAPAAQTLASHLTHKDKGIRRDAAWGLGMMGGNARRAVPDLIAALKDTDSQVVAQAAWALGRIGPAASDALPALQKLYDARRHRVIVAEAIRSIRGAQ